MLRKVERLEACGIFSGWRWPPELEGFSRYNLIFGWNYSGKTTLSRAVRAHELHAPCTRLPDLKAALQDGNGRSYVNGVEPKFSSPVAVFNSDFVEDNIGWEEGLQPILLVGRESKVLKAKLDQAKAALERLGGERRRKEEEKTRLLDALNGGLSTHAQAVKNALPLPDFNRTKLEAEIGALGPESRKLTSEDLDREFTIFRAQERLPEIELKERLTLPTTEVVGVVNAVLAKKVTVSTLSDLAGHPDRNHWVDAGRPLHLECPRF